VLARVRGQELAQVLQRLVLVLELELEQVVEVVVGVEQAAQEVGPQWHRHNRQQRLLASSWHRASSIRWCRFSRPVRQRYCASCQRFERRRRLRVLR
jgi:hypothetical protein